MVYLFIYGLNAIGGRRINSSYKNCLVEKFRENISNYYFILNIIVKNKRYLSTY